MFILFLKKEMNSYLLFCHYTKERESFSKLRVCVSVSVCSVLVDTHVRAEEEQRGRREGGR